MKRAGFDLNRCLDISISAFKRRQRVREFKSVKLRLLPTSEIPGDLAGNSQSNLFHTGSKIVFPDLAHECFSQFLSKLHTASLIHLNYEPTDRKNTLVMAKLNEFAVAF